MAGDDHYKCRGPFVALQESPRRLTFGLRPEAKCKADGRRSAFPARLPRGLERFRQRLDRNHQQIGRGWPPHVSRSFHRRRMVVEVGRRGGVTRESRAGPRRDARRAHGVGYGRTACTWGRLRSPTVRQSCLPRLSSHAFPTSERLRSQSYSISLSLEVLTRSLTL